MNGKIVVFLVCMLMFSTVAGSLTSAIITEKSTETESGEMDYSHNILSEFFTMTTCVPCKYAHRALNYLYIGNYHPFNYITFVYNKNTHAMQRKNELNIIASPTVCWDGDYRRDVGASSTENSMTKFNTSIIKCGNRNVKDIDLTLDVEWLGATNEDPEDGETGVEIEKILSWTISEMEIDVEIISNEASQYNGHLHVYVTEVNSTWWDDKFGDPYTHEFKDYAYNQDTTISGGGTWTGNKIWDCTEYDDGQGRSFENMTQDNTMVIAAVFDEDNNDYTDEIASVRVGDGTDPKRFDVYFGNTTPPPKVLSNFSSMYFYPEFGLNFSETYYWKIDVWDKLGNPIYGDIWSFTTRDNTPPNLPSDPYPMNNSIGAPIDVNLTWVGGDPENDDVTYDVYFGEEFPLPKYVANQSETWWQPYQVLDFNKRYFWRIDAWDEYGLNTTGEQWTFRTEENLPPDPAYDPYPKDGATAIPGDVILSWNGSDPNSGDTIKFDVYFSDTNPPRQKTYNQSEMYYDPYGQQNLSLYKDWYWRIVTWDSMDESSDSGVWVFTTGINHEPTDPNILGPDRGVPNVEYDFIFVSTDEDGHDIRYRIDWGDDTPTVNTELYASGEEVTLSHSWETQGEYEIEAKAYDEPGAYSGTSHHVIVIPRAKAFSFNLFEWIFERFPNAILILSKLFEF